jgi:hypothetical protein
MFGRLEEGAAPDDIPAKTRKQALIVGSRWLIRGVKKRY